MADLNCRVGDIVRLVVPEPRPHEYEVGIIRAAAGMVTTVSHLSAAPDWWQFEPPLTFPASRAFEGAPGSLTIHGARDYMLRPMRPDADGVDEMLRIAGRPGRVISVTWPLTAAEEETLTKWFEETCS